MTPKRARRMFPLATLAAVAGGAVTYTIATRRKRALHSSALRAPVSIAWDDLGVPTIVGACRDDALFGLGYATAADRLFQMDLFRRAALGRLSEVIGPSGLPNDRLMRLLGVPDIVTAAERALSDDARGAAEAYTAGVNLRVASAPLPLEFRVLRYRPEPWRPADSLAVGRLLAWMLANGAYADLCAEQVRAALGDAWSDALNGGDSILTPPVVRELSSTVGAARHEPHPFVRVEGGSNAWAVAGERSETGAPLLASDPHLSYNNPSLWHEATLDAPGFHVAGVTIPGVPAVGIGRTPTFAWGFTAAMVPQTFLYRETLNDAGDAERHGDDWTPLVRRVETIAVRGAAPHELVVRSTPRGPLFSDLEPNWSDGPVSIHWTGMEPSRDIDALLKINTARNIDDALAARADYAMPTFNMAAADAEGNIASISFGRFAVREDRPGLLDPTDFPPRYIPAAELPLERNPARGWIASANGRIVGPEYPYPLRGNWEPRFRITRIAERLDARARHSPADMRALQLDQYSTHAALMTPALLDALDDETPAWALADLRGWDFQTDPESRPTLLYHAFFHQWVYAALERRLSPELTRRFVSSARGETQFGFYDRLLRGELDAWFGGAEARVAMARECFRRGLAWIAERQGPDHASWTWGAAHTLTFRHPFGLRPGPHGRFVNVGPFEVGGDRSSLRLTWWDMNRPFDVLGGPSMRFVADLRDYRRNWLTNTLGQSGGPLSRHYRDQVADFLAERYHTFPARTQRRRIVIRRAE